MRNTLIILLAPIVLFSLGILANDDCPHECTGKDTCNAKKISNVCYYIFKEKRTWNESKNLCDEEGLKMGKISEDQLYNFNIQDLMTDLDPNAYAWLGGRAEDLDSWTFLNNVTVSETSANVPPEPTDGQELHLCGVVSDDGTLDKDDCRNMKYFICRFADWRGIATYYVSELPVTWYEAGARCLKLGGSLFSLKEKEDTNFLKLKLTSQSFKDQKLFLGLTKRRWVWQDGKDIIHYNWRDKEPNKLSEKCINVIPRDGVWNDADCNEKFYTLCQREVTIPTKEPEKKESSEGGIPIAIFIVVTVLLVIAIIAVVSMAIWIWKRKPNLNSPGITSNDNAETGADRMNQDKGASIIRESVTTDKTPEQGKNNEPESISIPHKSQKGDSAAVIKPNENAKDGLDIVTEKRNIDQTKSNIEKGASKNKVDVHAKVATSKLASDKKEGNSDETEPLLNETSTLINEKHIGKEAVGTSEEKFTIKGNTSKITAQFGSVNTKPENISQKKKPDHTATSEATDTLKEQVDEPEMPYNDKDTFNIKGNTSKVKAQFGLESKKSQDISGKNNLENPAVSEASGAFNKQVSEPETVNNSGPKVDELKSKYLSEVENHYKYPKRSNEYNS